MSTPTLVFHFPVNTDDLQLTFDDVSAAAPRLNGIANETPVITSRTVNDRTGATARKSCRTARKRRSGRSSPTRLRRDGI